MPQSLSGPLLRPASGGPPRQLVVLLHGVGADGNDLIGLAPYIARALPDAEFLAPDAPFPYDMAPFGRQWFSLQDRSAEAIAAGVRRAAPMLDAFLDEELERRGLGDSDLALLGFSQGTMMALHVALRRQRASAGVLAYSGLLADAGALPREIRSRPPVLLIHGEVDEVVPAANMERAAEALRAVDVPVETALRPALGHGVDEQGLALGIGFLGKVLSRRAGPP